MISTLPINEIITQSTLDFYETTVPCAAADKWMLIPNPSDTKRGEESIPSKGLPP